MCYGQASICWGREIGKGQAKRKDNVKRNDQVKVKTKGSTVGPSQGGGDWGTKGGIHEKYPPLMIKLREPGARKDVSTACSMQSKRYETAFRFVWSYKLGVCV